jgi:maltooligosyltrehalose trehalohydrolase
LITASMAGSPRSMSFGATLLPSGGVRFRYWSPSADQVVLELLDRGGASVAERVMERADDGWHEFVELSAGAGTRYRYRVAGGVAMPDPASRSNPVSVHGPSEVVDPSAYDWQDGAWRGAAWHTAVLYELHVGCFTPEGTFEAAARRLPELKRLGITAVEVMPVSQFAGDRGWGYDGVLPFAPHPSYGPPDAFRRFVDVAHGLGLMVLLDVVYNHFGPDGNYLPTGSPAFFNPAHQTPWGSSINFDAEDSATVRTFFIDNAVYWLEEFHVDGLRLDAIHAILDTSDQHIVVDIAHAMRDGPGRSRQIHLVLENEANQASLLTRDENGTPLIADAQWDDDFHHAARVIATGESDHYYAAYVDQPVALLGRALAEGFIYQGQPSLTRGGEPRGEPSGMLPSQAFIAFLQNHDQIGNRPFGDRLDALAEVARIEALLACLLLAPSIPMLFMGEEFAASTPFLYFCDFHDELANAVTEGRRAEFAGFPAFSDVSARERIPDPNAESTFQASKLDWDDRARPVGAKRLAHVGRLLDLRHQHLVPLLAAQRTGGKLQAEGETFVVEWPLGDAHIWTMRANLGAAAVSFAMRVGEETIFQLNADSSGTIAARIEPDGVLVTSTRRGAA